MIIRYARLVKFSHTVFALPFAAIGFFYALHDGFPATGALAIQVLLCMVLARSAAMAFNRWADRRIDARNPRTAAREIPAGIISPKNALVFTAACAAGFIITALTINTLCGILSPVALLVVMGYSYCKRFTALAHLVLGLGLSIAPVGAYIALSGRLAWVPCLLAGAVLTWVAGFDVIYALQDAAFDRAEKLHSIPARFSARNSLIISALLHSCTVVFLILFSAYMPAGGVWWAGFSAFVGLLVLQHVLVTEKKQRHIGLAFGTLNGLASLILAACAIVDFYLSL